MKSAAIRKHLTRAGLGHLCTHPIARLTYFQTPPDRTTGERTYHLAASCQPHACEQVLLNLEEIIDLEKRRRLCAWCSDRGNIRNHGWFTLIALAQLHATMALARKDLAHGQPGVKQIRKRIATMQRDHAQLVLRAPHDASVAEAVRSSLAESTRLQTQLEDLGSGPGARNEAAAALTEGMKAWESRNESPVLVVVWEREHIPATIRVHTEPFRVFNQAPERATVLIAPRYVTDRLLHQLAWAHCAAPSVLELAGDEDAVRQELAAATSIAETIEIAQRFC